MAATEKLGAKLGPRMAQLALAGVLEAQRRGSDTKVKTAMVTQDRFFRLIGNELAGAVGGILRELLDSAELPDSMRPLLEFVTNGRGQAQALLAVVSTAQGMASSFGGVIGNRLAPVAQADFAKHPNAALPPAVVAAMAARGMVSLRDAMAEGHLSAIDNARFQRLVLAARSWPDLGSVLELRRRNAMSHEDAVTAMVRQGYNPVQAGQLLSLDRTLLDIASVASMVVRGVVSAETGRSKAATLGYRATDFDLLVKATGNPPGPMDLLTAYRRGIIDQDRLHHGIRQGDLKNEWIDVIEKLRYAPLSGSAAVEAAVEGHLSKGEAAKAWAVDGNDPADFETAYQTAGSPLGVQQMGELFMRGEMTRAQVIQGIRESRLKPKYTELALKLARRLPPMDNIRMALRDGVITKEQAISRLMDLGYDHTDAAMLAGQAVASKHQAERDLTKAEITELYLLHGIDKAKATTMLHQLGYDHSESTWILQIADLKRTRAEQNALAGVVRAKFVAGKLTDSDASLALDKAGIPSDQRDHYLTLWGIERGAQQAQLSVAQAQQAFKRGIIDVDQARAIIAAHGYDHGEQDILLKLAGANI